MQMEQSRQFMNELVCVCTRMHVDICECPCSPSSGKGKGLEEGWEEVGRWAAGQAGDSPPPGRSLLHTGVTLLRGGADDARREIRK